MKNLIQKSYVSAKDILHRPFIKKFAGGVFTQGILSITNFIIGISLARQATKSEYGIYVIAFSTILVFSSIQNALVNSPLTVLLPEKKEREKKLFLSGLAVGQWFIFIPLLCIGGLILYLINLNKDPSTLVNVLFILLFVLPMFFFREFTRVVNYYLLRVGSVIGMDLVFVIIALPGILLTSAYSDIKASSAIIILGIGYLLSAVVGQIITKIPYKLNLTSIKKTLKETWHYSRWALVGIAATNLREYGYVYIISIVLTLQDTADVSAARLFLMPFGLFISSSQRIFLSKGAHILGDKDITKIRKFILFFILVFLSLWFIWVALLFIFHKPLIQYVLSSKYNNISFYLLMWALVFFVISLKWIVTNSLQIFKEFKKLAIHGVISSLIMLISCLVLLKIYGPIGALISFILGDLTFLFLATPLLLENIKVNSDEIKRIFSKLKVHVGSGS